MAEKRTDLSRLCIHSITNKPWNLEEMVAGYAKAGVPAATLWTMHIEPYGAQQTRRILEDAGITCVSVCRGGFFPATSGAKRQEARDENRRIIDMTHELGCDLVVLVCGAVPDLDLPTQRQQITDGIASVLPHAEQAGVRLSIEPLHPMYADCRSAVNTLEQANNMCVALNHSFLGVTVDVYHLWWDPHLKAEIERAGRNIFSFHVSDWRTPTRDLLNDRGIMGEGCIDIPKIRSWVEHTGFNQWIEVEIFSSEYWEQDQDSFVARIIDGYRTSV
ncbi:MAG: sugar phosphate isomerase/epimerase family protein [Candidatus Hydrogenedentota bacterium]